MQLVYGKIYETPGPGQVMLSYCPDASGINFGKNIPPPKLDYQNVVGLSVIFLVNQHPLNQYV